MLLKQLHDVAERPGSTSRRQEGLVAAPIDLGLGVLYAEECVFAATQRIDKLHALFFAAGSEGPCSMCKSTGYDRGRGEEARRPRDRAYSKARRTRNKPTRKEKGKEYSRPPVDVFASSRFSLNTLSSLSVRYIGRAIHS